jgi:hypothetical protein
MVSGCSQITKVELWFRQVGERGRLGIAFGVAEEKAKEIYLTQSR